MPKAVIVGAGINGLASAWALVRRGWKVEILEAGTVPCAEAASHDRHRMIRAHYPPGTRYGVRMPEAFAAWDRLWADLEQNHYRERGVIALSRAAGDWTDRVRAASEAVDAPHEILDPEALAARFPVFETEGVRYGMWSARGGALLSDAILVSLARRLLMRGAAIRERTLVTGYNAEAGVVWGPDGGASGDVVLFTAGVGLLRLARERFRGFTANRCTVLYLDPPADLAGAWAEAPAWIDLGDEDDLWGLPPIDGIPLKIGYGRHTAPGDPARERGTNDADIKAILGAYRGRFRGIERFTLRSAVANFYLMAPEERFLLARDGRAVFLSADSGHGFKFGALTGEDVAEALDGGDFEAVAQRLAGHDAPGGLPKGQGAA